mgnify:CR=1 FL=1
MEKIEKDELHYAGGKPLWFIALTLIVMITFAVCYGYINFLPELSNWLSGDEPDAIQWAVSAPGQ